MTRIKSHDNALLEKGRWVLGQGLYATEIALEIMLSEARAVADWCATTDTCRPAGELYGPDGQHSRECLEDREDARVALVIFRRLLNMAVSGNLADVEISERGFPKLTREHIRTMVSCPICQAKEGEFCRGLPRTLGGKPHEVGFERLRNHHERMQAAQNLWFEKYGNLPVIDPASTNSTTNEKE